MKIVPITRETWIGFFTYIDEYHDMLLETDVPFEMKINFDKGLISGVRTDDESAEVFDRSKPIRVTGEANGKHIKFVVMYPGRYYANEF